MKHDRVDVRAIKERVDIVALISRYVSLSKSGSGYKGRCPFHKDDTPSMTVSAEKGLWHCFGCGEGGDAIGFLMKIERLSFVEAMKRLAAEVGLSFDAAEDGEREKLRGVMAEAASMFAANLTDEASGRRARDYLIDRGYEEDVWPTYGLGYALPGWDHLKRRLLPKHGQAALLELGLLVQAKEKASVYDRFRDRTIFTIFDLSGRPIAFGGRAFDGEPKYLNSPKTPLFDKGRVLYGLSWARDAMAKTRAAILVEGYTDVLTLHVAGLTHAVGSMGTSLTQGQADLLGRFVDEVVIAYDQDAAGGAAAIRGMQILRNSGLAVRVARLPVGEDPDGLVRKEGAAAMEAAVAAAVPFHRFFIDALIARYDAGTIAGKEQILSEAREFYAGIVSIPFRDEIVVELAHDLDLAHADVASSLKGRRAKHFDPTIRTDDSQRPETVILTLVLRGDVAWSTVADQVAPPDFSAENRPIVEALAASAAAAERRGEFDVSDVIGRLDEETARRASSYALSEVMIDPGKGIRDAVARLVRAPEMQRRMTDLDERIKRSEKQGNRDEWLQLMEEKIALKAEVLARKGNHGDQGIEKQTDQGEEQSQTDSAAR